MGISAERDWTGNHKSVYITHGASNHSLTEREAHDYYATEPKAVELLCDMEHFSPMIWECACGEGHISKVLEARGYGVVSTDLIYRGYGVEEPVDFLAVTEPFAGDIVTNPPYKYALEFTRHALDLVSDGHKVAMFLKLTFLEGKSRRALFDEFPPKTVYVSSSRLDCAKNGNFENTQKAIAYAWFIWVKGCYQEPVIRWFN